MGDIFRLSRQRNISPLHLLCCLWHWVLAAYQAAFHANCTKDHKKLSPKTRYRLCDGGASYAHYDVGHPVYFAA
jgi:hypothetical protein